jgi:signal transduction histidine kinase
MESTRFFTVDASLMQHLGALLISDDMQALIELIKNAYDADATRVRIVIDAPDSITISDNGHGMTLEAIERGWLTLSNSLKAEQKREGRLTEAHRTPLGDKGVGRLSAQRLGNVLELTTVPKQGDELYTATFEWSDFKAGEDLTRVPVRVQVLPREDRKHGTTLRITELADREKWITINPEDLRNELASVVSPYKKIASFQLQAILNGREVSPSLITENIRGAARQNFKIRFDGSVLHLSGSVKNETFLGGARGDALENYQRFFLPDGGQKFYEFLLEQKKSKDYNFAPQEGAFATFHQERRLADVVHRAVVANPGPFEGEVDSFAFTGEALAEVGSITGEAFSAGRSAKDFIQALSGIRVYRDGFTVKTNGDWLGLSNQQTSGGSYYGLRPLNTMGYILISARENGMLREKTDREGFVDDPYYRGFKALLDGFVVFAARVLDHLRTTWNTFVKGEIERSLEVPSRNPEVLSNRIRTTFESVEGARMLVSQATDALTRASDQDSESPSLFGGNAKLAKASQDAREALDQANAALLEVDQRKDLSSLLAAELTDLRERMGEVYELVSLGITAEALSHEISNVLERLSVETRAVQKHATSSSLTDQKVLRYFEVVRTAVSALEKQISHLDPALRFAREKRDRFKVSSLVSESVTYFQDRLADVGVTVAMVVDRDFDVRMNRGKFVQVLDNLLLNAEYWVKNDERAASGGRVFVHVDSPRVVVEDTGPGVEPAFEETLFDAFVTSKPRGKGRGLGLFIVQQLLDVDGCRVELLPERNGAGRRYRFALDLGGVLVPG